MVVWKRRDLAAASGRRFDLARQNRVKKSRTDKSKAMQRGFNKVLRGYKSRKVAASLRINICEGTSFPQKPDAKYRCAGQCQQSEEVASIRRPFRRCGDCRHFACAAAVANPKACMTA